MKMKPLKMMAAASALASALGLLSGCDEGKTPVTAPTVAHKHEHKPPHGGTPVVLGNEEYHVELVQDPQAGRLQAYVFDGELENFVRIAVPSLEIDAKPPGKEEVLTLQAVPNNATGEKVGDTSLFEAQAGWLKQTTNFDAVLKEITVRGKTYQNVAFNFPKGNDTDETDKK
jgi:hypothetical protein